MNNEEKEAVDQEMKRRGLPDNISDEELEESRRRFRHALNNASVKKIVPDCDCRLGLKLVDGKLACPQCGTPGIEDDSVMSR